jgi:hypothetical protein
MSTTEHPEQRPADDVVSTEELVRRQGVMSIGSVDELARPDLRESDEARRGGPDSDRLAAASLMPSYDMATPSRHASGYWTHVDPGSANYDHRGSCER